jgi:hypothetical protein
VNNIKLADSLRIIISMPSILCTCRYPILCTTILFLTIVRSFIVKQTGINHPLCMELENPLLCSQQPTADPTINQIYPPILIS